MTGAPNFPDGLVFEGYRNVWRQVEVRDGMRVVRVKTYIAPNRGSIKRALDFFSFFAASLWHALFEPRPDVVVATSPQPLAGWAAWFASLWHRCPFVLELSDLWPASMAAVDAVQSPILLKMLERAELFLYARASRIAPQTIAFFEDLFRRGVPASKMSVVPNGVELEMYAPRPRDAALAEVLGIPPDAFVAGYFGTLGVAHGLGNILAAAESLRDTNIRILLMGSGAEREILIAESIRRRLENVMILPPCSKPEMPRYWSLLDVSLVHLKDDPVFATVIPSKIFESMAMGLPVLLAAPAGEAGRLIDRHACGEWVPPGDHQALADRLRAWESDPARRDALREAALRAAPLYSRERQAREFINVLEETVSGAIPVTGSRQVPA